MKCLIGQALFSLFPLRDIANVDNQSTDGVFVKQISHDCFNMMPNLVAVKHPVFERLCQSWRVDQFGMRVTHVGLVVRMDEVETDNPGHFPC